MDIVNDLKKIRVLSKSTRPPTQLLIYRITNNLINKLEAPCSETPIAILDDIIRLTLLDGYNSKTHIRTLAQQLKDILE